jgi:hypothetical protein
MDNNSFWNKIKNRYVIFMMTFLKLLYDMDNFNDL